MKPNKRPHILRTAKTEGGSALIIREERNQWPNKWPDSERVFVLYHVHRNSWANVWRPIHTSPNYQSVSETFVSLTEDTEPVI